MNRKHLANAIRALSMDGVQQTQTLVTQAHLWVWLTSLKYFGVLHPWTITHQTKWADRDRFYHLTATALKCWSTLTSPWQVTSSIEDLKNFRQLHSKTQVTQSTATHQVSRRLQVTLGQGITNAVGMAMAESTCGTVQQKEGHDIVDHYICIHGWWLSDGRYLSRACSLAGTLGLGKLVCFSGMTTASLSMAKVEGWFSDVH